MKYLFTFLFLFLRSGVEAMHGIEFRHSTRMPPELNGKWGTERLNTRFPSAYPAVCGIRREADLFIYFYIKISRSWRHALSY